MTILILLWSSIAGADTLTQDFSTTQFRDTNTLVWNTSLKILHPPLAVNGWKQLGASPAQNKTFSVGDGHHGSFDPTTYANFGTINGNDIVINTDQYPDLQFTDFNLVNPYRIRPVGSKPLLIRSLKNILIDGPIDCDGDDGTAINIDKTQISQGGLGHCGGGPGGNGGSVSTPPSSGTNGGANVTGGGAGPSGGALGGASGAGGGSYSQGAAANGTNPNGGGTASAGSNFQDDPFTIIAGGSGGGGGYVHNQGSAQDSSGGAGGAGGGVVLLYAVQDVTVTPNGKIWARGGSGGSGAGKLGGGGGAGGGGSIQIFAGGIITFVSAATSQVLATAGAGGTSAGASGGNGAQGRTWIVCSTGFATGGFTENPVTTLFNEGQVQYQTGTFTADFLPIDTQNTAPTIQSYSTGLSGQGTSTLNLVSGSNVQAVSAVIGTPLPQYLKFQLSVNNVSGTTPATISNFSVTFDPRIQSQYDFKGSCGTISGGTSSTAIVFLFPLFLAVLLRTRRFRTL